MPSLTPADLAAFSERVAAAYNAGRIRAPIHLAGGAEEQLHTYFSEHYRPGDYVFSTWRSHHHALLAGVPTEEVFSAILAGRSISLCFPQHRFYASGIVAGLVPVALGTALGLSLAPRQWHVKREGGATLLLEGTKEWVEDYMAKFAMGSWYPYTIEAFAPKAHLFVGDMAARTGAYHEAYEYAVGHSLPLNFVVENNGKSVGTPTNAAWGTYDVPRDREYRILYSLPWPHSGTGQRVNAW